MPQPKNSDATYGPDSCRPEMKFRQRAGLMLKDGDLVYSALNLYAVKHLWLRWTTWSEYLHGALAILSTCKAALYRLKRPDVIDKDGNPSAVVLAISGTVNDMWNKAKISWQSLLIRTFLVRTRQQKPFITSAEVPGVLRYDLARSPFPTRFCRHRRHIFTQALNRCLWRSGVFDTDNR